MKASNRSIGDVRPSQVITTFGPGAVVDLQTLSIIVAGIDSWPINEELAIREPRLEQALGVKRFFPPTPAEGRYYKRLGTVPAFIFPRYQVCPVCETLSKIGKGFVEYNDKYQELRCKAPGCRGRGRRRALTVPAPFIVACPSGHLDDFPWREYAHRDSTSCDKRLRLFSIGKTGSVADIWVKCACGEPGRSVSDAFSERRSEALGECTRNRPWLGLDDQDSKCDYPDELRALQRGATNAWFPIVRSAVAIKEAASAIGVALSKCPAHQIDKIDSLSKLKTLLDLGMFPSLEEFPPEEVWQTIKKIRGEVEADETELRLPEWEALRDPKKSSQGDRSELFLEEGEVPKYAEGLIAQVVLARKLLEVRALTGFTRIDYAGGFEQEEPGPIRAPIYRKRPDWLPAVEVRGEGIFVELNEKALSEWEAKIEVVKRAKAMAGIFEAWERERGENLSAFPGARYVLLHSSAHALIRQLSLDCGYSSASIRERIYSSIDPSRPMSGILIYTASADSEGSLGGLVELGSPKRFPQLLRNALLSATLCSSDPLCADHQPDVHATINGAACHACILVPESSCESFNRFLDRNFLVPTVAQENMAFFKDVRSY